MIFCRLRSSSILSPHCFNVNIYDNNLQEGESVEAAKPEEQKVIDITKDSKSVRLDVYVNDDAGTVYDVEMQTTSSKDLPKRSRYYQGMIDLNQIEKGAFYRDLNKSFVIFI